jgi:hypothetical protein
LPKEVEDKVKSIEHVKDAEVEITFDPPWSKDLMRGAKLELGMLLIIYNVKSPKVEWKTLWLFEELVLLKRRTKNAM